MPKFYDISLEAEKDWYDIIEYTLQTFGKLQVEKYTKSLLRCLNDLASAIGQHKELDVSSHKVLVKKCQKHYIFALSRKSEPLLIIAILHEQMDLMVRLKTRLS